jgi:hypothetical protein
MCQEEILKALKKSKKPLDIIELMIITQNNNRATISRNCERLRKYNEIKFKIIYTGKRKKFMYYL